jgi:hypothetical protein
VGQLKLTGYRIAYIILFLSLFNFQQYCQEIPINTLLYSIKDYEYKLSEEGKYLAGIRVLTNRYHILITDLKKAAIMTDIPLGKIPAHNLNWISNNRIVYEAGICMQ